MRYKYYYNSIIQTLKVVIQVFIGQVEAIVFIRPPSDVAGTIMYHIVSNTRRVESLYACSGNIVYACTIIYFIVYNAVPPISMLCPNLR